jgi:RNA polymerase sigma-70 factor (ECF subfamily)
MCCRPLQVRDLADVAGDRADALLVDYQNPRYVEAVSFGPAARPMGRDETLRGRPGMTSDHREAFLELVRTHRPRLLRVAATYGGGERDDLLQEILLEVWRSLPRYRGEASLSTWAYRIAINTSLSWLRREIRRRETRAAGPSFGGDETGRSPDADAVLDDFLHTLGPVDRSVMLAYLEGLTHEETAGVVGSTAGAIAVRISRLKDAFKRRYEERWR